MPINSTSYQRGAKFERRVADYLRGKGWVVIRSAGSRGPCDLVAARAEELLLLQCKVEGVFPLPQRLGLYAVGREFLGQAVIVWRSGRNIMWRRVDSQGHLSEIEV